MNVIGNDDLVSLSEAAKLLPSPRAGKRTASSTVYRLACQAGLLIVRRGKYRFLLRSELPRLYTREPLMRNAPVIPRTLNPETERILREAGLLG